MMRVGQGWPKTCKLGTTLALLYLTCKKRWAGPPKIEPSILDFLGAQLDVKEKIDEKHET